MGQASDQAETTLSAERASLDRNLDEFETHARGGVDWRRPSRDHPIAAVGVAFGAGTETLVALGTARVLAFIAGRIPGFSGEFANATGPACDGATGDSATGERPGTRRAPHC